MGIVRVLWAPVYEPIWDQVYVISPRTAALYVFPSAKWNSLLERGEVEALGLSLATMRLTLPQAIVPTDRVPEFRVKNFCSMMAGRISTGVFRFSARYLGLQRTLELLSCRRRRIGKKRRSLEEILGQVKAAEGARHGPDCLGRSLKRWFLLNQAGWDPHFHLGVGVPSRRMHAWVSVDGNHVGEDPDEVVCYQPACEFMG
jgi:hypothetical protein